MADTREQEIKRWSAKHIRDAVCQPPDVAECGCDTVEFVTADDHDALVASLRAELATAQQALWVSEEESERKRVIAEALVVSLKAERDKVLSALNGMSPSLLNTPKRNKAGEPTITVDREIQIAWSDFRSWRDEAEALSSRVSTLEQALKRADDTFKSCAKLAADTMEEMAFALSAPDQKGRTTDGVAAQTPPSKE